MTHKLLAASFLFAGIICTLAGSTNAVTASLSGQGSTIVFEDPLAIPWTPMEQELHAAAPETQGENVVGQIALGALFIALGFGLHALWVIRERDEWPVPVHAGSGKKLAKPKRPRKKRKMDVIWIERTIRL